MENSTNIEQRKRPSVSGLLSDLMVGAPEYYSGRGVNMEDLPPHILRHLYRRIERQISSDAALAFAHMVNDSYILTATTFLQCLYMLEANGWKYDEAFTSGQSVIDDNSGIYFAGEERSGQAVATLYCDLARRDEKGRRDYLQEQDQTQLIIDLFIRHTGICLFPREETHKERESREKRENIAYEAEIREIERRLLG